ETLSRAILTDLVEREEQVISISEGTNQGTQSQRQGFPIVKANISLVYSPFTHFVAVSVRGAGVGCPDNEAVFVLLYEIEGVALGAVPIPSTLQMYRIDLRTGLLEQRR